MLVILLSTHGPDGDRADLVIFAAGTLLPCRPCQVLDEVPDLVNSLLVVDIHCLEERLAYILSNGPDCQSSRALFWCM